MNAAAEVGGDSSSAIKDRSGELHSNTSKIRTGAFLVRRDTASASAGTASNAGKIKRKIISNRSAKSSRETSPTRSMSTSNTLQPQTLIHPSASHGDFQQPRSLQPHKNAPHYTSRLTKSLNPPTETRQSTSTSLKDNEILASHYLVPTPPPRWEGGDEFDEPDNHNLSEMRTPRSNSSTALETVTESSLPATPIIGLSRTLEDSTTAQIRRQPNTSGTITGQIVEEMDNDSASTFTRKGRAGSVSSSIAPMSTAESESESGYRSDDKTPTSSLPKVVAPAKIFGRRPTVTGKEISSKAMTVETETVSSVPQVGLGAVGPPGGASIRSKKSTDTIRAPRREKRRIAKKSVAAGPSNPSSKADIFAAKIAEAVDEANSSDSEETFVYESNPPDSSHTHTHQRPSSKFHSRTPSATSIGPDPRGQRLPLLSTIDGTNSTGRKGMKFVNNSLNKETSFGGDGVPGEGTGNDRGGAGSSREHTQGDRNGGRHHNGHRSILAEDGPFHRSTSHKQSTHSLRNAASSIMSSRQSSRPPSPKHAALRNGTGMGGKRLPRSRVYEADVENGDDEHTPLIPAHRSRPKRRPLNNSSRQMEYNARRRGCIRTYASCIVAVFAIVLILTGVGGFLIATTNPLLDVRVINVTDVLVSKQEIMLDLVVEAINPNAIAVTIGSMDVNLFAKSSHVGDGGDNEGGHGGDWWGSLAVVRSNEAAEQRLSQVKIDPTKRLYPPSLSNGRYHNRDTVNEGTDPPNDLPENDKKAMLLGRIFSFDSVLNFEGSPLRRIPSISTGELRLAKPGNKTEEGGTARWERVLLHPFELIVRGVLKYQLPLSGRIRTTQISGSVMINPELFNTIQYTKTMHTN